MVEVWSRIRAELGRRVQKTDTAYRTNLLEMFNANLERVWRKYLWRQSIAFDEVVTTVAASEWLYLPKTVEEVLILTDRVNDTILLPQHVQVLMRKYLDTIETQSIARRYTHAGEYGVNVQPSVSALVEVRSNAQCDGSQTIRIWGISGGNMLTEAIALNSLTWVASVNAYTEIHRVSKSATTNGVVTIREQTANTTLSVISPWEYIPRYPRIRLHEVPDSADTLYLTYKKRFIRIVNDEDVVELPVVPVLMDLTYADALREQRQFQKAQIVEQRARADLQDFIQEQSMQGDTFEQSLPDVPMLDIDRPAFTE